MSILNADASVAVEGITYVPNIFDGLFLLDTFNTRGILISATEDQSLYVSVDGRFSYDHGYSIEFNELAAPDFTAGDDWITWRGDYQHYNGGAGLDTLSFYNQSTPVTLQLSLGFLGDDLHQPTDHPINVQNIERFKGTTGDDVMMGSIRPVSVYNNDDYTPSTIADVVWIAKEGNDVLGSTQGQTTFHGGLGIDVATYIGASAAVNVSLFARSRLVERLSW